MTSPELARGRYDRLHPGADGDAALARPRKSHPVTRMPALVGETIPENRISNHPGRRRFVRNETRTRTPRRAPISGGPSGRVSRRHGLTATPAREADRRVHAASYPATANANTITVHTITPAIVIRTVCCHMVSIPYSVMLDRILDPHNPARSDGDHREFFSGGCRKKTGPVREPVRQPCLFADAEGAEDEIQLLPQRRQRPRL